MRVLVAEDDPVCRRLIEVNLRQWKYEVVPVSEGNLALELLRSEDTPRLALLDWMMPGKDGLEICRELRARPARHYTYIILLTSRSRSNDVAEGIEAGADDYVIKPFEAIELKARLLAGSRLVELQDQLYATQERLRHQATYDGLCGIWNRASILEKLEMELHRSRRQGTPLSIMMVDLDEFKTINDTHGHQVGDAVLRSVAQCLAGAIRIYDAVGRYGGEEFLIVAPGCDAGMADALCRRLQEQIRQIARTANDRALAVTCSFGVVTTSDGKVDPGMLIGLADAALYRAKANGRDRIETSSAVS